METISLVSGDRIPVLGLGTWKISPQEVGSAVIKAVEIGYRHIDCARIYANEAEVGQALNAIFAKGTVNRQDLWVTSKLWNNSHRAEEVEPALKTTLSDLNLDYVDLYLMHWPVALKNTVMVPESGDDFLSLDDVPLLETWQAMEACVHSGLCRNIGVSNFSEEKLRHLIDAGEIVPAANQVESHPLLQQNRLLEFCKQHRVCYTAYSPLGSGDRPEHMRKENDQNLFELPVVTDIANQHGISPAQVLLAWAVQRGTVAIPKSTSESHLRDNLAAAEIRLQSDAMSRLAELDQHYRYVDGSFWETAGSGYTVASLWDE